MIRIKKIVGSLLVGSSLLLASGHGATHWGYTGHTGPEYWGMLSHDFFMCQEGKNQSPIDLSFEGMVRTQHLELIDFRYKTDAIEVVNNGHSIQVNMEDGSYMEIDDKRFYLKQFHFHSPSENTIEGKSFPLEAHFVHLSNDGEIAVVALLFEEGRMNPTLKKIWSVMPHHAGDSEELELSSNYIRILLPKDKRYYRFSGSLTTPPCSEGVRWFVFKEYAQISDYQIEQFTSAMGVDNNRPVQPLNARKILK